MNKQELYRNKYKSINPKWKDSLNLYIDLIAQETNTNTKILDIGCGHADFLKSVYAKTPYTYGFDSDNQALAKNTIIKNKIVGTAERLPFEDNFFDLVVSAWVLEHLDSPDKVFQEILRVLKPKGKVIFLTPNFWNYVVWINRLIPHILQDFLTQKLYNRQKSDAYPVRYKINSVKKINKLLLKIGFKKFELILNGDPSYISFNNFLFKIACFIEYILDKRILRAFKVHIIGVYKK